MAFFKKFLSFFTDIAETIVIAIAVFLLVWIFLVQAFRVQGNSMFPNFQDGEMILTNKISYRFSPPKRGDVIIFQSPIEQKDLIKRIIGLPGETISIENGKVEINNNPLEEKYLTIQTPPGNFLTEGQKYTIPNDNYIVLGDNRINSLDSKEWGPLERKKIIGKAWFVYWPPGKISLVPSVNY